MPLRFTLRQRTTLPIEVEGVTPDACERLSLAEIERLPIQFGNRMVPLVEWFDVSGAVGDVSHVWQGDLGRVHWLGAGMRRGTIRALGDVGRHAGSGMVGGELEVAGDAGDWLGAEMRGGIAHIRGNAANNVGAVYRGGRRGMTGGTILVDGSAGHEVGHSMRRGLIAIGGACGDLAGFHMLAGTIVVVGTSGRRHGAGMRRGTLVFLHERPPEILPSFRHGCSYQPLAIRVVYRELWRHQFKLPRDRTEQPLHLFNGDFLNGGRGELLVTA